MIVLHVLAEVDWAGLQTVWFLCILWPLWECVLCPTENAKNDLDRLECYTNRSLAQTAEIIQKPRERSWCLFLGFFPPVEIESRRNEVACLWSFLWHHPCSDSAAIPVRSLRVGLRHSQNMGLAPENSWWEQMSPKNSTQWHLVRCKQ